MTEEIENQDSIPESAEVTTPQNESDDVVEKLTKAEEYGRNQKIRAEKAEKEYKTLKAKMGESETPKKEEQSNETNSSERIDKLTLKSEGITHSDDVKIVLTEAKRLKLPVEEVAGMEHIKAKLKTAKEQREAESGMPTGSGKPSGTTKNSVEHWVDKKNSDGSYATPDDLELAEKVIDARIKKDNASNQFADGLYGE